MEQPHPPTLSGAVPPTLGGQLAHARPCAPCSNNAHPSPRTSLRVGGWVASGMWVNCLSNVSAPVGTGQPCLLSAWMRSSLTVQQRQPGCRQQQTQHGQRQRLSNSFSQGTRASAATTILALAGRSRQQLTPGSLPSPSSSSSRSSRAMAGYMHVRTPM